MPLPSVLYASHLANPGSTSLLALTDIIELVNQKPMPFKNAKDYGVVGDGVTDDWANLQAGIDDCAASGFTLFIPDGTFLISQELTQPDNSRVIGAGMTRTLVMLSFSHTGDQNCFTNSENDRTAANAGNSNIYLSDLSVHTNFANSVDQNNGRSTSANGVGWANVHYCAVERVWVREARGQHGIDIEASVYSRAGGTITLDPGESPITAGYPATSNGDGTFTSTDGAVTNDITYQPGSSTYVWIIDCRVENWGDDGITTHDSEYIWIVRPVIIQSGALGGNTNAIEIDDGSRKVWVTDPICWNSKIAVCVKGHVNAPAPYDVFICGIKAVNCMIGFRCYHTSHMDAANISPTAHNIRVDGVHFEKPMAGDSDGVHAVSCQSYSGVVITAVQANGRGSVAGRMDDIIAINGYARGTSVTGVSAHDWVLSNGQAIYRTSTSTGPGNVIRDVYGERVNGNGVTATGTVNGLTVDSITLIGSNDTQQLTGIDVNDNGSTVIQGGNYITGYTTAIA